MKEKLSTIANWLQAEGQHLDAAIIRGASIDSRTVKKGDLFIPFRGEQVNGHKYVGAAIEKGAAASLWLKDEPNPPKNVPLVFVEDAEQALQKLAATYREQLNCKVIGITGSNGKTSTKDLIASVLSPYFNVRKTEGNFNNELGLPLTILSLDKETEFAVLEMGMSGFGEISFLSKLAKPDYAIITNIGEAHMQDLGSREGIAKAKFEIIDGLASNGQFFFDGDEPLLRALTGRETPIPMISFGYGAENDLSLQSVHSTDAGSEFTVAGLLNSTFTIPVYGAHQVKNTLAAILIAHEVGVESGKIRQALQNTRLTDMRMQPIVSKNEVLYINDAYNAAPTSMRAALTFMGETTLRKEKWVVLGDMLELGEDEKMYHEGLADQLLDMDLTGILLYGPRMKWLYDQLAKQQVKATLHWSEIDYLPIQEILKQQTHHDSVVLLKGSRGMALERLLKEDA